jgi:hypothetical protein
VDYYEKFLAVERLRKIRRRYLVRAIRHAARSSMHAARCSHGTAGLVTLISMAVISTWLWIVLHGS